MEKYVYPCSPKYFNVVEHFEKRNDLVCRRLSKAQKGDLVYIYVGSPFMELKYRCIVEIPSVDDDTLQQHDYATLGNTYARLDYMLLKLDHVYPPKQMPLERLKKNGLGQVQRMARVNDTLAAFIDYNEQIEKDSV